MQISHMPYINNQHPNKLLHSFIITYKFFIFDAAQAIIGILPNKFIEIFNVRVHVLKSFPRHRVIQILSCFNIFFLKALNTGMSNASILHL